MEPREVVDPELAAYAAEHSSPEPGYLRAIAEATREASPNHTMMVGPLEGRLLGMMVAISGARRILEVGTFTGYSALSMAEAMPPDGSIVTCEIDSTHASLARANIASSPHADRIEVREGKALLTIERLAGPFDLVFIDADKTGTQAYYEAVLPKLSPHGLILVDNVLWRGLVLDRDDPDASTAALASFNDLVADDPRVDVVMLPVRDGLTILRKRS